MGQNALRMRHFFLTGRIKCMIKVDAASQSVLDVAFIF